MTGRLIRLVQTVPVNNIDDLQDIIADWTAKGTLDNAIIDMLWQYVTLRVPVKEDDFCAALELLRMAAVGRKTIISRNIDLVINIGLGDKSMFCFFCFSLKPNAIFQLKKICVFLALHAGYYQLVLKRLIQPVLLFPLNLNQKISVLKIW